MAAEAKAAFDTKKLPVLEPGAMSFMMSKDGYLADDNPHFHPHVMFVEPLGEGPQWGANLPGSPVFAGEDKVNPDDDSSGSSAAVVGWDAGC
jgi:hypothetical protein